MDDEYRYALTRDWGPPDAPGPRGVCWVMLNPSTADAQTDDPTIRRCLSFTARWGYNSLSVVNLFALRATDPRALRKHQDPVGLCNDAAIALAVRSAAVVVAAWGSSYPTALRSHVQALHAQLRDLGAKTLGHTAAGDPRHPLYVAGATELEDLR